MLATLVLLKPDAFERRLVGKIIHRFESADFHLLSCRSFACGDAMDAALAAHYEEHCQKPFNLDLIMFMRRGPVMALSLGKHRAVEDARILVGATDPGKADRGTIRGDFMDPLGGPIRRNLVHASDSEESAARELRIWLGP